MNTAIIDIAKNAASASIASDTKKVTVLRKPTRSGALRLNAKLANLEYAEKHKKEIKRRKRRREAQDRNAITPYHKKSFYKGQDIEIKCYANKTKKTHNNNYEKLMDSNAITKDTGLANRIKACFIPSKYKTSLAKHSYYDVVAETAKAVNIFDGIQTIWVPKASIKAVKERAGSMLTEKQAEEEASEQASRLIKKVSLPLLTAPKDAYNNLLALPLEQYQKNILETLKDKLRVYLGMEQGTGKTPVSLARILLFNDDRKILIICQKSLILQWWSEIEKFCPQIKPRVTIINYDMIWRDSKKEFMSQFDNKNFHLILEEVGCLGHEDAKRTAKSMELAKKAYSVQMLSGSFFGGRFEKFYACACMQGFTGTRAEYNDLFTVEVPVKSIHKINGQYKQSIVKRVVGYKNIDKLVKISSELGAVFVRIAQCIDMPMQRFSTVTVESSKEAKTIAARLTKAKDILTDNERNSMFVKLRTTNSLANNKDKLEYVENFLDSVKERICIFYAYNDEREQLLKLVKKAGRHVSEVSGNIKDLDDFRKYDDTVALLQIASASRGLNLQECNYSIFTSPFAVDDVMQAEFRTWRHGQTKTCFYYTLTSDNSFDKNLMKQIAIGKKNVSNIG